MLNFIVFVVVLLYGRCAFSISIRKAIGRRDKWECQGNGCRKSFKQGDMVHAAHCPEHHRRDDPTYDTVGAGRILCVDHHQEDHERGTSLGRKVDDWAVAKLVKTDRKTKWWRKEHG